MKKPNVILIVIDTLREDHGKYIEESLTSDFKYYPCAIAPSPWTIPTHASIFTGMYPLFHDAHETKNLKIPYIKLKRYDDILLPYLLKQEGYKTVLITQNELVMPDFGFNGFDIVKYTGVAQSLSEREEEVFFAVRREVKEQRAKSIKKGSYRLMLFTKLLKRGEVSIIIKLLFWAIVKAIMWPKNKGITNTTKALKKIISNSKNPLFLFINIMEVHEPYYHRENWNEIRRLSKLKGYINPKKLENWKKKYREECIYTSKKLKKIFKMLKKQNIYDNTLIIITSDHGQLLGEGNKIGHGTYLDDILLRVPLWIKYPTGSNIIHAECTDKYISLTSLKGFVLNAVNGVFDESSLYSEYVFAETFGIPEEKIKPKDEKDLKILENLEKYRVCMYFHSYKIIFNVNDWKFELKVTDKSIEKEMKNRIFQYLNLKAKYNQRLFISKQRGDANEYSHNGAI